MSESASTTNSASALDDKTATVQYKPATSLTGNNALAHYEQSRGYDQISHDYPIFMACTGTSGAVISLTSYPYTACTRVSCQAVSPTNGLGTRLIGTKIASQQRTQRRRSCIRQVCGRRRLNLNPSTYLRVNFEKSCSNVKGWRRLPTTKGSI